MGAVKGGLMGVVWEKAGGEVAEASRVGGRCWRRVEYTGGVENGYRLPTATPGCAADETREDEGGWIGCDRGYTTQHCRGRDICFPRFHPVRNDGSAPERA